MSASEPPAPADDPRRPARRRAWFLASCVITPTLSVLMSGLALGIGLALAALNRGPSGRSLSLVLRDQSRPALRLAIVLAVVATAWLWIETAGRSGPGGTAPGPPSSSG